MAHSRIIEELIARDPEHIRADLEAIKREQASLETEAALLNQVLAIQAMRNGDDVRPEAADFVVGGKGYEVKRQRPRRSGPSISAAVLDIMRENADMWMTYDDVYKELRHKGIEASRNAMRVALGRWAEREKLEADDDGTFRYIQDAPTARPRATLEGGNS